MKYKKFEYVSTSQSSIILRVTYTTFWRKEKIRYAGVMVRCQYFRIKWMDTDEYIFNDEPIEVFLKSGLKELIINQ